MIDVEVYQSPGDLECLREGWEGVLSETPGSSVFMTPDWIVPWWQSFGRGMGELLVAVLKENGRIAGVCPLVVRDEGRFGWRVRKVVGLTNCHTPKFDFALGGDPERLLVALLDCLSETVGWNILQFDYVPAESPTLEALQRLGSGGRLIVRREVSMRSPFVEVRGGFDAHYQSLSKKFRQNTDYAFRGLGKLGPVEFEEIRESSDLTGELREGFEIEKASWKGAQGTAILDKREEWGLYLNVAQRAAAKGGLRLYFAKVGGKRVAFFYCLSYRGVVSLLKVAYDPAFAKYSPGTLLQRWVLARLYAERETLRYDMLGVDDEWKLRWTNSVSELQAVTVFRADVSGRLLYEMRYGLRDRARRVAWLRSAAAVWRRARATTTKVGGTLEPAAGGRSVSDGRKERGGPAPSDARASAAERRR